MADTQRAAVYAWERELPQWESRGDLSLDECRALVARVWADYRPGGTPPPIHDGRGRRKAAGASYGLWLPRWSRSPMVVLHEAAHALHDDPDNWHGPVFATLCLDLWARYVPGFDKAAARAAGVAARAAGVAQRPRRVHFAPVAACPRPVSRAYRQWEAQRRELAHALRAHEAARPERYS